MKKYLVIGLIGILALFVMFKTYNKPVEEKLIDADLHPQLPLSVKEQVKEVNVEIPGVPEPSKSEEWLIPSEINFFVNKIQVFEKINYPYIPIKKDRIRTFSGNFGIYDEDPREEIRVELCSFPYKLDLEVKFCEIVDLNFADGKVFFVRGYDSDEYIGNQALQDFGAYFVIKDSNGHELARSNTAFVN